MWCNLSGLEQRYTYEKNEEVLTQCIIIFNKYINFFEMYKEVLNEDGVILSDNLYFHDLLFEEVNNRDLRQLVRKVGKYNDFLINHPLFETHIFKIGDGVGVSTRKK